MSDPYFWFIFAAYLSAILGLGGLGLWSYFDAQKTKAALEKEGADR